jgi:DNA polymerase I-like protein with 3'-5' exonuclease and polymerase domains
MKWAMVYLDQAVKAHKLDAHKVIDMHDEGQWECHPKDVDKLKELMGQCVRKAGEYLGLSCPLASDAVDGATWYETH